MAIDAYAHCPCGSGKKFKFCCQSISDEMDRIVRLMEGNQPHVAIQQLEQLAKKHPQNAWVGTTRGMLLLDLNDSATARDVLKGVLDENSDNELAIVLYAAAMIRAEGFDNAKRAIHRAFQRSAKKLPALVGDLASSLAATHAARGHMMASREHLALALRLAPEERRQQLFVQLLELDGADDIPYPLRGSHLLPTMTGSEDFQKETRKAQKYAAVGCWSTAADVFSTLANAEPERAELWHAVGLCRAWDGDEKAAAEALHRAAKLYANLGIAAECETIAQLLDDVNAPDKIEQVVYRATVPSVSRLLTALDGAARIQRLRLPPETDPQLAPVASYLVLNTDHKNPTAAELSLQTIPRVVGNITVFDAAPDGSDSAYLLLGGNRGSTLDDSKALVTSLVGDLAQWVVDQPQPEVMGAASTESQIYESHWYLSDEIPLVRRRQLFDQFWVKLVSETWPNQPLRALGGKSPRQAVGDPSLLAPLYGAIYCLDAAAQRREKGLDLDKVFEQLGIAPLPPLDVTDDAPLGGLSVMQLHRLPVAQLNDQQLITVVNRSMLIQHDDTLYEVLKIAIDRPGCADQFDRARILRTLSEIAAAEGRRDEAFAWLERGRNLPVPEGKTAFQNAWAWDMAELGTRLEDPADPELNVLLKRFVNYYGPKVPQIRPHIEQMLQAFGVPSPWDSVEIVLADGLSASGGTWSPSAAESVPAGGGKLWLPGQ